MKRRTEFVTHGDDRFCLRVLTEGLTFDVSRLRWERGELLGLLSVSTDCADAKAVDGVLSVATFNLTSITSRTAWARHLEALAHAPELDFGQALEELCQRAIKAEQAGRPPVLLRNVELSSDDIGEVVTVAGFPILRRHPTILFADGGTGKSTLALYFAGSLERAGVSTLFLDWEMDCQDHRRQLERMFGRAMPDVKYRRCERPLAIEAEGLADYVHECGIEYVICDSIAFACDGPPEAAEVAARYFRALRQLKVGSLNLAHVTKSEGNDKRPFGSTFWHNGARACWYAEQTDASTDNSIQVGLFNRKQSRGSRPAAIAFDIEYGPNNGSIMIHPADVADDAELSTKLPLRQRMQRLLQSGPRTIADIAEQLDAKPDSVEKTAKRGDGKFFTRLTGPDGIYRVGLLEKRRTPDECSARLINFPEGQR